MAAVLRALHSLGWKHIRPPDCTALRESTRDVLLKPRLIEVLQTRRFDYKGKLYPLSPSAIDQILRELSAVGLGDGLLTANERLYAKLTLGVTVTEFMPDGRKHRPTVAIIDWADARANRFDVCDGFRVLSTRGTHERAPAIVGFVNGVPLAVIEMVALSDGARPATGPVDVDAIGRQLRNQRHDEIPSLFAYAHLLLAMDGYGNRYGTTGTPPGFWAQWSREEELDDARIAKSTNCAAPGARERLLASLLTPQRLLDLVRGFVLFDSAVGKVIARHQQFFGVRALLQRLSKPLPTGARQGGVVWHTAGSGKSFTMVFLTKALMMHDPLRECRMLVITDRHDLEQQLARNFSSGGAFGSSVALQKEGERSRASTGRDLARRIGRGKERITFALVQKFGTAARLAECRNESPDIVVLVDEAHRSQSGEMHAQMRKALPRAAYIAFTGTPLLREEKTAGRFGPIVHAYTMRRAVDDGAVVPLLYEERVPALSIDADAVDRWFETIAEGLSDTERSQLSKKYASSTRIHGSAGRVELIAWDIAVHFSRTIKKVSPGLKGQVVTASKLDAIRYKMALDRTGLVTSVVVISAPGTREGSEVSEGAAREVRTWWKQNAGGSADAVQERERRALQAFGSDDDPDLLIVVDRLLTGFDEPRNAVLYIDKPLKGHGLIQATLRVNRLHDAKRHGLLVDYRGILKELDTAVRAYQNLEKRTQGGYDIDDLDGLYTVRDDCPNLPALQRREYAARDASGTGGRSDYDAPMRALIDLQVVGTEVREPQARYVVHSLGENDAPDDSWTLDKVRCEAELIQSRIRATIELELAADPGAQKSFSEQLASAIERTEAMFEPSRKQYAQLKVLEREVNERAASHMPIALATSAQARAFYAAILTALGEEVAASLGAAQREQYAEHALAICEIVSAATAEHSLHAPDIEAAIRNGLLQLLYRPLGLAKAAAVTAHVVRIVQLDLGGR
ncbi:MAG: HsdR family type I site-specific deoxyribonuclease [Gammaproteobacteria bacterium]|nr:HsdR family type I site-specific deoxyribonuclease [Gammaproteobacteria bacterium]